MCGLQEQRPVPKDEKDDKSTEERRRIVEMEESFRRYSHEIIWSTKYR